MIIMTLKYLLWGAIVEWCACLTVNPVMLGPIYASSGRHLAWLPARTVPQRTGPLKEIIKILAYVVD